MQLISRSNMRTRNSRNQVRGATMERMPPRKGQMPQISIETKFIVAIEFNKLHYYSSPDLTL